MIAEQLHVQPGGHCQGALTLPGDKSISHRAILFASLADGESFIEGFLEAEDCLATVGAMRALGISITRLDDGRYRVVGRGLRGLSAPTADIDCGNAGTLMRLLAGILAGQSFASTLTGDASLQKRPMRRVADPLINMGAKITTAESGTPPIHIEPNTPLNAVDFVLPVASAQVKSCCLLAGMYADGETVIHEAWPTRDHSERLLQFLGYPLEVEQISEKPFQRKLTLQGQGSLKAATIRVPADISHAAFLLVAACITPGAKLTLADIGLNPTRTGILHCLKKMGADITVAEQSARDAEPVATITVAAAPLKGISVPEEWVPLTIDEFPAFAIAAAFAEGETVLRGAEELRHKESDRIAAMVDGINALGGSATALPDGMIIQGQPLTGGTVDAVGDHRIAMAFAIAATAAKQPVIINNAGAIATSWPAFVSTCQQLGYKMNWGVE